jgi:valyl-tRNA synthetase
MEVVSEARRLAGEGETPRVTAAPGFLFRPVLDRVKGVAVVDDESAASSSVVAAADRASLEAKLAAAIAERDRALAKLANEGFTSRAPAHVVEAEREKAERYAAEASDLERRLNEL